MQSIFAIAPATGRAMGFLGAISLMLAALLLLFGYLAYSMRNSRVAVSEDRIRLIGDLWGRTIPIDALQLERAAIVDLNRSPELMPRVRTLGTGLPGYASGWFRLRNGEKALTYLTRREGVAYLPTDAGYALLLSVEEPELLLEELMVEGPLSSGGSVASRDASGRGRDSTHIPQLRGGRLCVANGAPPAPCAGGLYVDSGSRERLSRRGSLRVPTDCEARTALSGLLRQDDLEGKRF